MKKNKQIEKLLNHTYIDGLINEIGTSQWRKEKQIKRRERIKNIIFYSILLLIVIYLLSKVFVAYAQVQEKKKYMTVARLRQSLFLQNQQRHPTGSYCVNCYNK